MRHFGAAKRMHFNATTTKWTRKNMQTQLCLRRQSKIMRLIDAARLHIVFVVAIPFPVFVVVAVAWYVRHKKCCCCCFSSIEVQVHCLACGDLFLQLEEGGLIVAPHANKTNLDLDCQLPTAPPLWFKFKCQGEVN